jgi:hypothetical protein
MKIKIILLLIMLSLLSSCEDVVTVESDTAEPKLVVDASILWYKGSDGKSQIIRLSTSTAFYAEEVPKVSGAEVYITDSDGNHFNFMEIPKYPGIYVCNNFLPELWQNYTLTILYNGHSYTATETLYPVPNLLRTTQEDGGLTTSSQLIKAYFQDPGDQQNFYMHRFNRDGKRTQSAVFEDEFVNGNETFTARFYDELQKYEQIDIELMGISERYYNYMSKIYATVSEANVGPFEVAPAVINGNILNRDNAGENAFGYFRLSEVSVITHISE